MTDELRLLREFGADLDPPSAHAPADLRRRVLTGALADGRTRRIRPWLAWRLGAAGAAAAAVAAAVLVLPGPQSAPAIHAEPSAVPSSPVAIDAGRVLRLAAEVSARRARATIRPDQFVFTEEIVVRRKYVLGGPKRAVVRSYLLEPALTQTWRSADGSRSGQSRSRPITGGSWQVTALAGCSYGPNSFCDTVPAYRDGLPTDAEAMVTHLYAAAGPGEQFEIIGAPDQRAFMRVPMVLDSAALLPDVQAAVFEAAARIPGVTVRAAGPVPGLPPRADGTPRSAIAVTRSYGGYRADLLFDDASYEYVGMIEISTRANRLDRTRAGDVLERTVLLRSAPVDRAGQLP